MEPVRIIDNVCRVEAMDYGIRDFHGCRTYNAYLNGRRRKIPRNRS